MVKNYNLPGARYAFTMIKSSTKEIPMVHITKSTAVYEVPHGLNMAVQKQIKFSPYAIYSDMAPCNLEFWQYFFGKGVI